MFMLPLGLPVKQPPICVSPPSCWQAADRNALAVSFQSDPQSFTPALAGFGLGLRQPLSRVPSVRAITVTLVSAALLLTLIGCGSDENDWLKQQDEAVKEQGDLGLLGGKPSDEDIRKACRFLQRNDWDYEYALEAAAMSIEFAMLKHLNAMQVVLGDDVQDYCEAKLVGS